MISKDNINNARILLVDNDLVNVLALKNILHTHGFRNISNSKPASSARIVEKHNPPSLVVLNIDNTNGAHLQLLKNLQGELAISNVPLLIVTRDVNSQVTQEAVKLGAKEVISWPFAEIEVVTRITALLENFLLSQMVQTGGNIKNSEVTNQHLQVIELTRQIDRYKKAQEENDQLVGCDSLTGLANTASLCDHLRNILRGVQKDDRIIAMLLFSLENFSDITKSVGYDSGDKILQIAADRISESVKKLSRGKNNAEEFFTAKYSGGKFVVVLNDLDSETRAISIAHRILAAMSSPFELPNMVLDISTQVGVSLAPRFTTEATELVRQAEVALHSAKLGSQPLIVYEKEIDNYDPRRLALMAELRKAINNDGLYLVYQPKVNIKTGVISGVEALLRWNHPELGLIPPNEFIPMAEQSSVIKPLTVWQKNNIAPDRLILEITESAMMQDPNMGLNLLNQLSELGVQISIDDYGTGYSSLAYLKRLPVNEMKIDRTFIKDMADDEDDKLIVGTTIDMGHNFGLRVIAEGVEDGQTVDLLKQMGCDQVQGFYYAKPMPVDELYDWLTVDNKVAWTLN
ncbi:MAG: EAL domain-containing protein [Gammaproteobacteria bacterium]